MAKFIKGVEREQLVLFPITIEEMISEENKVRVIDKFVESLDIEELGIGKKEPNKKGTNHYDAKDMLKLYVYAYGERLRSSRRIAEACKKNIEVIWLMKGICPDYRTISEFRRKNAKSLKEVFKEVVRLCKELEILGQDYSQDGVKIEAVNSKERNYTLNKIDDRINRIDKKIEKYLKELDKSDEKEEEEKREKEELERIIEEKNEQKKELEKIRKEIEEAKESQKSLTDPESRLMKNNGKFSVCYNNQVVVDTKSHIVANYQLDNNPADIGTMCSVMEELKEMLGIEEPVKDITDQGYKDTKDMARCLEKGIIPEVTLGKEQKEYEIEFEYEENEITEEERKSKKEETIKKCLRAGVIPEVYEDYLTEIEVKEKIQYETLEEMEEAENVLEEEKRTYAMENECFVRDKKTDRVYCPMGEILRKKSKHHGGIKYCNKEACKNCKKPCTTSKFKELTMSANQVISGKNKELKREYNSKSKKKKKKIKVVKVKLIPKKEDTDIRMQTSEHPHGTMKRADDMRYFTTKGKVKTCGELALYYTASNLRRMCNIMGISTIIKALDKKIMAKTGECEA